jgi:short-subunit dehydrogenase
MNLKKKFNNKVVIITGASSGIGKATALAFARAGATTVLVSRTKEKLEAVANEIRQFNPNVRVLPTDVSSESQVKAMIDDVVSEFGKIDVLINNAGTGGVGAIESDHFVENTRHLLEGDFFGKVYCARAVLPVMRKQGNGSIVNLSSVVGKKAFPGFGGYSATMHAILAFSDALRQEMRETGINVSTIHPALTQTPFLEHCDPGQMPPPFRKMTPISAEKVARKILKAVVTKRSRVIVPWQPWMLLFADAISAQLGDLFVRLLENTLFMILNGMYRGKTYQFEKQNPENILKNKQTIDGYRLLK